MVSGKGKEKVDEGKGKRKWSNVDEDKTGRKRKNRGCLQFFEDEAYQVDKDDYSSDDSMFDLDDFVDDDFTSELNAFHNQGKPPPPPVTPKEEEMGEEEFERMMSERYKPGAGFVTYAEDYEDKTSTNCDILMPSLKDPSLWKVKCMIGRERSSAICLMQKHVELEKMGNKLLIVSACALDHVKGFIFVEADKQNDIYEACKGLSTIYSSKMAVVPHKEIPRLFSIRSMSCAIAEGAWARVRSGRYKGDLAQVVSLNQMQKQKKVTIKLVPRVDLKALAAKIGGGVPAQRNTIPPQRLISASELEDFRPLIHHRRDHETNQVFEVLDGMMLKDGYLYKKVPFDSLVFFGVMPTDDELVKFEPAKEVNSSDAQWLSQLMEKVKNKVVKNDKCGKSGVASSSGTGNDVVIEDLVFFGRKDFGIVIGIEKDNTFKVMKAGSEGPVIVNVKQGDMKNASFGEKIFSVLDKHSNPVSVSDTVRILDGPLKDREGIVKKIFKGILFLFDNHEEENGGYLCAKANICEKLSVLCDTSTGKGDQGSSDFADVPSPKTPLSHDQSFQECENKGGSSARHDGDMFSVGQSLRIRVGPLKGYLCRVLAVRRSDITVKLDSLHKILTVKSDQLSEVRGRNSAISQGENLEALKPFDFLNSENGTSGWAGTTLPSGDDPWNAAPSTERTSWSDFPSSNVSLSKEDGVGDCKSAEKEKSSWGRTKTADQDASWTSAGGSTWGQAAQKTSGTDASMTSWALGGASLEKQNDGSTSGSAGFGKSGNSSWENDAASAGGSTWEQAAQKASEADAPMTSWGSGGASLGKQNDSSTAFGNSGNSSWEKNDVSTRQDDALVSGNKWSSSSSLQGVSDTGSKSWGSGKACKDSAGWNKPKSEVSDCGASWGKQNSKSSWKRLEDVSTKHDGGSSWGKNEDRSSSPWKSACEKQPDGNAEGIDKGWNDSSTNAEHTGDQRDGGWGGGVKAKNGGKCIETSWGKLKPSSDANSVGEDHHTQDGKTNSWSKGKFDSTTTGSWGAAEGASSDNPSWGKQPDTNSGDKAKGWKSTGENSNSQWGNTNQASGWVNSTSAWGIKNDSGEGNASNMNKEPMWNNDGERRGGWGQGNFSKGGSNETESSNGSWSAKGNWSSGNGFGGRGGNEEHSFQGRGDRGCFRGRGDRGGFRGRGDRGGFRGRGDRGGFRGRGDRGGFGGRGRGRGDGEEFRGGSDQGGRGRGGWRSNGDNSDTGNNRSWGNNSNNGTEGWKRNDTISSWGQSGGQSWSQQQGSIWNTESSEKSSQKSWSSSGWGSGNAAAASNAGNTAGASPWESVNAARRESDHAKESDDSSPWSKVASSEIGKKPDASDGWGSGGSSKEEKTSNAWGKKEDASDGWGAGGSSSKEEKPSNAWGKKQDASDGCGAGGSSNKEENPSDSWGKKPDSSDGCGAGGSFNKEKNPSDSWGKKLDSSDGCGARGSSNKEEKPSDSRGKKQDASASDGWGAGGSSSKEEKPSDAWGQASKSSWGSCKGGW